ncbi:unnamed protein product, partial [Discosporangium mesarthrocarpum]
EAAARERKRKGRAEVHKRAIDLRRAEAAESLREKHEGLGRRGQQALADELVIRQGWLLLAVIHALTAWPWREAWKEQLWKIQNFRETMRGKVLHTPRDGSRDPSTE